MCMFCISGWVNDFVSCWTDSFTSQTAVHPRYLTIRIGLHKECGGQKQVVVMGEQTTCISRDISYRLVD